MTPFESDTELTDNVVENLDLDEGLQQQVHKLENVESERLKVQELQRQLDRRDATVEELERTAKAEFDQLISIREAVQEREDGEEFEKDYEANKIEAKDYDRVRKLLQRYEGMVAPLVIERAILLDTVDELRDMVDEQKMRHDESFILEKVDGSVEKQTEFMMDTVEKMMDGFESRMDRMIESHERVLKREGLIQDGNGGDGPGSRVEEEELDVDDLDAFKEGEDGEAEYVCPKADCDSSFETERGLQTHLGQVHNIQ